MASTILTDLGQSNTSNILLSPELLQWALQYPDDKIRTAMNARCCDLAKNETCDQDWTNFGALASPSQSPRIDQSLLVPMNVSYDGFKDSMGPLGTTDSQVFSNYACSVPVLKSGGSLFVSVLVADLVFLSVLWTLTTWAATYLVQSRNSLAMACEMHSMSGDYRAIPLLTSDHAAHSSQQKLVPSPRASEYDLGDIGQITTHRPLRS